jgi:hypothetical protein
MGTSLPATKLHIPSVRSELAPRPRLTGRLDEGLERKLTLVSHLPTHPSASPAGALGCGALWSAVAGVPAGISIHLCQHPPGIRGAQHLVRNPARVELCPGLGVCAGWAGTGHPGFCGAGLGAALLEPGRAHLLHSADRAGPAPDLVAGVLESAAVSSKDRTVR